MPLQRRILLVDDDQILARALLNVIQREAQVEHAPTVARAKRLLQRKPWDAWIIDVGLPDGDGLSLLGWARERGMQQPALVLTGRLETALANRADLLRAQLAYKPDIVPNVKAFIRRVRATAIEAAATSDRAVALAEELARDAGMTPSEVALVRLVGAGVPRAELATRLGISENTVKTRVRFVLEKARLPNLDALAREVLELVAREATTQSGTRVRPAFDDREDAPGVPRRG